MATQRSEVSRYTRVLVDFGDIQEASEVQDFVNTGELAPPWARLDAMRAAVDDERDKCEGMTRFDLELLSKAIEFRSAFLKGIK